MKFNGNQTRNSKGSGESKQPTKTKFKAASVTQASAALMIPPAVSAKLSQISAVYGLPLDVSAISLQSCTPENVKALRKITSLMSENSKLLPEMLKLIKQLLKSEIRLAEFHKNLTQAAIKHQESMDKNTAEIFLAMAGYTAKAGKLEHRTNTRNNLIEKRNQAYANHYQTSVFGNQSQIIDAEYQLAASNSKILTESKVKRLELNSERKNLAQEYIDQAFAN